MAKERSKNMKNFLKGIFAENPLFVSILGTCPALATTKTMEAAIGMGILFTFVLICSSVLVSLLRKLISEEIRTLAYIVIIATFVTIVKMFSNAFLPALYSTLGVFISLIVVNCIVLGRAEAYASKNGVFDSFIDALGMGVGYTLAIVVMAFFRELLGTFSFTIGAVFPFFGEDNAQTLYIVSEQFAETYSISLFQMPVGAFIVFAIILAVLAFIKNRKAENKAAREKIEKQRKAEEAKQAALKAQQQVAEGGTNNG